LSDFFSWATTGQRREKRSMKIDKAMDLFITPITESKGKPPDPAKVKAAFNVYLEKLRLAD